MVIFDSAGLYISSATSLKEKVVKVNNIIDALLLEAANSVGTANLTEYSLDSGQTKIKTMYRGVDAILTAINGFERIKQTYLNQLNGRVIRLVDGKNFIPPGVFGGV